MVNDSNDIGLRLMKDSVDSRFLHYENTPMPYTAIFMAVKMTIFS